MPGIGTIFRDTLVGRTVGRCVDLLKYVGWAEGDMPESIRLVQK